jgi:hypothetical protein
MVLVVVVQVVAQVDQLMAELSEKIDCYHVGIDLSTGL